MSGVILIGASGWIGREVGNRLPDSTTVPAESVLESRGDALRPFLEDGESVVINAAGSRYGPLETMRRYNADLPEILAQQVARFGGHLVHISSAAEYGLEQPGGLCHEDAVAAPTSDYGRTKLSGTRAVLDLHEASVLRVFNIAASEPQEGSAFADIIERVARAVATHADAQLLSAGTVRDWVSLQFVCESIAYAADRRPAGLYNICSGTGVRIGDAVEVALAELAPTSNVRNLERFPSTTVIGVPDRWTGVSGLSQALGASALAKVVIRAASDRAYEHTADMGDKWSS
ncbi:NAD(P)-dependent oxidoreductase [Cellulomonas sp. P24]|uniref:NAD-dependent epimerase/dehydratase family protein n=1 Tax=Cellulomonas sp. P24 TaxID=2885206 RepID=UPI00216B20D2|nr:NAD(P)-dependent oxidoreductase [Cellulomonas sp. P24]MCR6491749.1 NAD(P)-dependent oxidoreductase [Cellulomonas sp. P24]